MNSLKTRTMKALGWDLTGRLSGQGVSFVISIFLARLLSPADFGLLAMVNVVVGIASVVMDMGFGSALVQRKEVTEDHYGSVFVFNTVVGLLLTVLLFSCSGLLARFYKREIIADIGRIMCLVFIINSFGSVIRTKLYKELNFKILTLSTLFSVIISGSTGVLMAFMGFGIWSLVTQSLLSPFLINLFCFIAAKWFPKIIFRLGSLKELWNYSVNIFISTLIGAVYGQLDALVIGKIFAPAKLGYYYRAKSLESMLYNYTSQSLLSVFFPAMSSVKDEKERFNSIVLRAFHIICFISFTLLGVLFLVSGDIIVILFSKKWLPSVPLFKILLLSSFVYPMTALFNSVLSSKGNSKAFLRITIIRYTILTPTFIILSYFGIKMFLYSFVVSTILSLFFSTYYASREIQLPPFLFLKTILPYVLIDIFITGILESISGKIVVNHFLHFFLFSTVFSVSFFSALKLFKIEGLRLTYAEAYNVLKRLYNKHLSKKYRSPLIYNEN